MQNVLRPEFPYDSEASEGAAAQQCGGRQDPLILGLVAIPQDIHDAELPKPGRQLAAQVLSAVNGIARSRAIAGDEQLDLEDQGCLIVAGFPESENSPAQE